MQKLLKPLAIALLVLTAALFAVAATGFVAVMLDERYLQRATEVRR